MRPRRVTFAIVMLVLLPLGLATPSGAVTYGERDTDDQHPYVGAAFFPDTGQLCSGTLIAEDVFLTAAHCTAGAQQALVNTAPDAAVTQEQFVAGAVTGEPVAHPDWADFADYPQTYDIGVVELHDPIVLDGGYPEVAGEGYLDALVAEGRGRIELSVVGYGNQAMLTTGPPWDPEVSEAWDGWRHVGDVQLVTLNSAHTAGFNLQHSGNPGHGGGTCYGDSGGPVLHDGTVVAVSSFFWGNRMCRGNNGFAHRVDIDSSQGFLDHYLAE